ncbi:GDSL esterase/lipase LTL1 [Dichanthelium oligosanthes]|uniref:GDSL esterase/lipase LTL1 n=1 Tax=Dichanthelium oligosanthes TaxID=888268 RepID=A0A1E5UY28_9POAL|nr:GDSL esterase/lipase LTL1 [Dichanthelium oligosanthes]
MDAARAPLLASVLCLLAAAAALPAASAARAFFVFGDSLVDNGNNNYLLTTARADAPPYGIDFPTHRATGRFSNGLNIPDIISEHLGAEPALPYLSPELRGEKLLVGANFASAGVGILNDTGIQFVREHRQDRRPAARLYELGARQVVVTGTGPLGCVPAELALHSQSGECAADLMRAVNLFNPQLVDMVRGLNRALGADVFVTANTLRINFDYLNNPQKYGFTNVQVACCGQGPYNGIGLCTAASNVCANRDVFAFWDAFHPTERANRIIVGQFMHGDTDYMHPVNLSTMLAMDRERL